MNLGYEPEGLKIYLFGESVDMRKQMNGLIALVEGTYNMDPFEKALFLFTNKKKDKIKALKWDENGFVVYYKRLENGRICRIQFRHKAAERSCHQRRVLGTCTALLL